MQDCRLPNSAYLYDPKGQRDVVRHGSRWQDQFQVQDDEDVAILAYCLYLCTL